MVGLVSSNRSNDRAVGFTTPDGLEEKRRVEQLEALHDLLDFVGVRLVVVPRPSLREILNLADPLNLPLFPFHLQP